MTDFIAHYLYGQPKAMTMASLRLADRERCLAEFMAMHPDCDLFSVVIWPPDYWPRQDEPIHKPSWRRF